MGLEMETCQICLDSLERYGQLPVRCLACGVDRTESSPACPECGRSMNHFAGLESLPDGFYCPYCLNGLWGQDADGELYSKAIGYGSTH